MFAGRIPQSTAVSPNTRHCTTLCDDLLQSPRLDGGVRQHSVLWWPTSRLALTSSVASHGLSASIQHGDACRGMPKVPS